MATYPFIALLYEAVASNSTATLSFPVPANEKFIVKEIFQHATGTFRITGFRDSRGIQYANFDADNYAIGNFITDHQEPDIALNKLPTPLELVGSITVYFDVRDASGGTNDVRIYLVGDRITG